jgi:iron complex outermembrane receptor protein
VRQTKNICTQFSSGEREVKITVAMAGLFLLSFLSLPSNAQAESAGARNEAIEEVIVTARRREETAQSVPIPISALSGEYLTERGITEIKNIEQLTPNLSFISAGTNKGAAQVFLRGIGQVNWGPTQDPKVGIYVDGVYLGRPQGSVFDLFDVERVEVLRGPQGTLFGRNTTAGLLQVITKDPTDEFEAKIRGGFGNDGQIDGDAVINIPLIDGTLSSRFALQTRKADGYMKDMSGREWNATDSNSVRGKLLWTPTDAVEVLLTGEFFSSRETANLGKCLGGVPGGATGLNAFTGIFGAMDDLTAACTKNSDYYRSNDNDPYKSEVTTRALSLEASWDLDAVTLTSISAWRGMDETNSSWGWATDFVGGLSNSIEVIGDQSSPYEQYSQEFRFEGNAMEDRVTWVAGVYGFRESATQKLYVPFWRGQGVPPPDPADAPLFGLPGTVFGPPFSFFPTVGDFAVVTANAISRRQETHATNTSWAVFAEATFDVTDKLAVTAGWRWTKDKREFKRYQFTSDGSFDTGNACPGQVFDANGLATMPACTQDLEYNEATPRIIVNYDINDDIMVYGSFSRGYSSGGMNGDIRMRPFLPEISDNFEAGMKSRWFDRRLQVNITAFQTDYENQQITVGRLVRGQPTADLINAQEATIEGIEMEIQATPWAGAYITASIGLLDGEYDEFSTVDTAFDPLTLIETEFVNDFSDTEFLGNAPYTYSVSFAQEFNTNNLGSITAGTGWSYRGRTYNTLERYRASRQGKYGILDARIRWDLPNGNTSVSIWGTNLGGREYYRAALDLPNGLDGDGNATDPRGKPVGANLGTTTIFPAEPRRYGITLTHSFDRG